MKSRKKTHRREVSYCTTANGIDINQAIIAQGAALACPRYNTRYLPFEQAAALGAPKKPGRARIAPRPIGAGAEKIRRLLRCPASTHSQVFRRFLAAICNDVQKSKCLSWKFLNSMNYL